VPSLSALSTETPRKVAGYHYPVLGTILLYLFLEYVVFFNGPLGAATDLCLQYTCLLQTYDKRAMLGVDLWSFRVQGLSVCRVLPKRSGLVDLLQVKPSLEAPDLSLVRHELAKTVPRLVPINIDQASKFLVLYFEI